MRTVGQRVVLTCAPWAGEIEKIRPNGSYDVMLDDGGKAMGMREDDLEDEVPEVYDTEGDIREEVAREKRATADKSWPPKTMETKVPQQRGGK